MNRKSTYKDLEKWRKTCKKQRERRYNKSKGGYAERTKWSEYECEQILKQHKSDDELALELGRSVCAIHVKRHKLLKKINNGQ